MIFDKNALPADSTHIGQKGERVGCVMKDVNNQASVKRVVCKGQVSAVVAFALDPAIRPDENLDSTDLQVGDEIAQNTGEFAVAATHLENAPSGFQKRRELMRQNGIAAKTARRSRCTTDSNHGLPVADDRLGRPPVASGAALIEPLHDDPRQHPDNPAQKVRHPRNVRILPASRDFH